MLQISVLFVILIVSLICSIQDIRWRKVHNLVILLGCLFVIGLYIVLKCPELTEHLISGAVSGLLYFLVRLITRRKLGMADVCFGIFQGFCLNYLLLPVCIGIEVLSCLIFILIYKLKDKVPFIPFMAFGLFGTFIVQLLFF